MQNNLTGYIGDVSYQEALRRIETSRGRLTLFLHYGRQERIYYFSEDVVAIIRHPREAPESCARGGLVQSVARRLREILLAKHVQSGNSSVAAQQSSDECIVLLRELLQVEFIETISWRGGLFELREGPPPRFILDSEQVIRAPVAASKVFNSLRICMVQSNRKTGSESLSIDNSEAARRISAMEAYLPESLCPALLCRELALLWTRLGGSVRSATYWKRLAAELQQIGNRDEVIRALEAAITAVPVDWSTVQELTQEYASAGKHREAERVIERFLGTIEPLRLYDLMNYMYRLLKKAPDSPVLQRIGADAAIRRGDINFGIREALSAGRKFEQSGKKEEALKTYTKVLNIDPTNRSARERTATIVRRTKIIGLGRSYGLLVFSLVSCILGVSWEIVAWRSFATLQAEVQRASPTEALTLFERESSSYPATSYSKQLKRFRVQFFDAAVTRQLSAYYNAANLASSGKLEDAMREYKDLAQTSCIDLLRSKCVKQLERLSHLESENQKALQEFEKSIAIREYITAFQIFCKRYSQSLQFGPKCDVVWNVPLLIDSIPSGASVFADAQLQGLTPHWLFVRSDKSTELTLSIDGYRNQTIEDILHRAVVNDDQRIQVEMVPATVAWSRFGGGLLAQGASPREDPVVVMGADGVLRAFNADDLSAIWECPLDPGLIPYNSPLAIAPVVVMGTADGRLIGYALATGAVVWSTSGASDSRPLLLGGIADRQICVGLGNNVDLINPYSGMTYKRVLASLDAEISTVSSLGSYCAAELETGPVVIGNTENCGRRSSVSELFGLNPARISGEGLVMGHTMDGRIKLISIDDSTGSAAISVEDLMGASALGNGNTLYAAGGSGAVACFDRITGQPQWRTMIPGRVRRLWADRQSTRNVVIALSGGDNYQRLVALQPGTGQIVWTWTFGINDPPSVVSSSDVVIISSPATGICRLESGPSK